MHVAFADRYTLGRELGRGGMATVYLALDQKHHRQVAIKVLKPELAAALGAERFLREIEIAARLTHPHILPLHDSGEVEGFLYYVMPYVEGETLRDRLSREEQLPIDDALAIAREVADALSYAHGQGVVHRDIKPENILLEAGHAVVGDFGIARAITAAAGGNVTATGIAIGTPAYMSPEQATGSDRLDGRTDIYSLACVLYEMLAGEPPFTGATARAIIARAQTETPRPIHHVRAAVPEALDTVIARAMAPTPADRYASAAQFADALGRAAEGRTVGAIGRLAVGRFLQRRPLFAVLTVGVLVGVGALFGWRRTRGGAEGAVPKRLAVLPFENVGPTADDYFADGVSDAVRGKLTALPGLVVIARTSSMQYRNTDKSPQDIAQELGVRYLLTGTVRWAKGPAGRRVQVSPELIEVTTARAPESRWQEPFDAAVTDVFRIQADIASRVAHALSVALRRGEQRALAARPTDNVAAYDAYLRGEAASQAMNNRDAPSLQRATDLYAQAVGLDSAFAMAWARLAQARALVYADSRPTTAQVDATRRALEHAVKLAPGAPETQLAVGVYESWVHGNPEAALQAYEAGLAGAPTNTDLLTAAAREERELGHWDQALARLERAQTLDPRSVPVARGLSFALLYARRPTDARAAADRGLGVASTTLDLIGSKILSYLQEGNLVGAQTVLRTVPTRVDRAALLVDLAQSWDLEWLLDDAQQRLLLSLPLSAFGDDRAQNEVRAETYWFRGSRARARVYADVARRAFEAQLRDTLHGVAPAYWLRKAFLGVALALLGRRDAAIREGRAAVARLPLASSGVDGAYAQHTLVRIYILTGELDEALDQLEPLLRVPYILSPGWLRIDPNFAPLRGNPRFEQLLAQR